MDKATIKQNGERVYEAMAREGRCKFSDFRSLCHLDNEAIYSALIFLCREERVQQEWDNDGAWYSIKTNN